MFGDGLARAVGAVSGAGVQVYKSGPRGLYHAELCGACPNFSAELKGPEQLLRIRPGIFDFGRYLGLKGSKTKPKIPGTAPTDRHTMIPTDSGPISA